jgi:hypothetical protein
MPRPLPMDEWGKRQAKMALVGMVQVVFAKHL